MPFLLSIPEAYITAMISQINLKRFTFEACVVGENRSNRGKKYNPAHILHIEE